MRIKLNKTVMLISLMLAMAACNEDGNNDNNNGNGDINTGDNGNNGDNGNDSPDYGISKCDGNTILNYKSTTNEIEITFDCTLVDKACAVIDGQAGCFETCTTENASTYACLNDDSLHTICHKAEDGKLYEITKLTYCSGNNCNEDTGKCVIQHDDEGKPCQYGKDKDYCSNNVVMHCNEDNIIEIDFSCHEFSCAVINGKADCFTPCSTEGEISYCDSIRSSTTHICTYAEDGKLYHDFKRLYCADTCDQQTGQCNKVHDDEGKACKYETDASYCDGDFLMECQYGDIIEVTNCGNEDMTCAVIDGQAGCHKTCTTENTSTVCESDNSMVTSCTKAEDGNLYLIEESIYCNHSCDKTTGQCIKIHENEGKKCYPNIPEAYCDENVLLKCSDEVFEAKDCAASGGICGKINEEYKCYHPCTTEGETNLLCSTSMDYSSEAVCRKSYDGKLYYDNEYSISCTHGCDKNTGKCIKIHEDEGKECAYDKCDENMLLKCSYDGGYETNVFTAEDCMQDGKSCATINSLPNCYEPCTTEGETYKTCVSHYADYGIFMDFGIKMNTCIKAEDGRLYYSVTYQNCEHGCDDTTLECIKIHDDEGQHCYNDFNSYCDGNLLVSCSYNDQDNIIAATDCTQVNPYIRNEQSCTVVDGHANCRDTCTTKGETLSRCNSFSSVVTYSCIIDDNGNLYRHEKQNYCRNGCDYITGTCIRIHENEGNSCELETTEAYCDGNIILECGDHETIEAYDCASQHKICAIINDDIGCYEPCTTEGEIQYTCDSYLSLKKICTRFDDDKLFYQTEIISCKNSCNQTTGQCEKIHEDEYQTCNQETENYCDGELLLYCYYDYYNETPIIHAKNCEEDGESCGKINSEAVCYQPCTTEGVIHKTCTSKTSLTLQMCVKSEEGTLYIDEDWSECQHGCDQEKGECIQLHEDEGKLCSYDDYDNDIQSYCSGDFLLSCSYDNTIVVDTDCSKHGESCQTVNGKSGCYEMCTLPGSIKKVCDANYSETMICSKTKEGKLYYTRDINLDPQYCEHGCDRDTGECIKIHEAEGQTCNRSATESYCDGNTLIYCNYYDIVEAYDCTQYESICTVINGKADCYAETCTTEGLINSACVSHDTALQTHCLKAENGNLYLAEMWEECENGCDETTGECLKIHEDEYKKCNPKTDADYCDGDFMLVCDNNRTIAVDCSDSGKTCGFIDGSAGCFVSCTTEGEISTYCSGNFTLTTSVCTKDNTGNLIQILDQFDCEHGCDDSTHECTKLHDDEGQSCQHDTDQPFCKDDMLFSCNSDDYLWVIDDCSYSRSKECAILDDRAGCFATCNEEGKFSSCEYDEYENIYISKTTICAKSKDGNLYQYETQTYCNACDEQTGECLTIHEDEGKSCDYYNFNAHCDGNIMLSCEYDYYTGQKIVAEDCSALGENYICRNNEYTNHPYCDELPVDRNSCQLLDLNHIVPGAKCSPEQAECDVHVCWTDVSHDGKSYTEYLTCIESRGDYIWYAKGYDQYMECNHACSESGHECDNQSGQLKPYR